MDVEELQAMWNAQADKYNSWDELGLEEIVAFVQEVEREACAKLCREVAESYRGGRYGKAAEVIGDNCVEFIRARSNVEVSRSAPLLAQVGSTDGLCPGASSEKE